MTNIAIDVSEEAMAVIGSMVGDIDRASLATDAQAAQMYRSVAMSLVAMIRLGGTVRREDADNLWCHSSRVGITYGVNRSSSTGRWSVNS